jgi:hypothetical protein
MMLSDADVKCLEKIGYDRQKFVRQDRHGFIRLRNRHGFCVFYNVERGCCKIYERRPLGCRIYPIMCDKQERIILDDLCPMTSTISKIELKRKGKKLMNLLERIDYEATCNRNQTKNLKGAE